MKKRALAVFMALCVVLSFVGTALISTFTMEAEAVESFDQTTEYIGYLKSDGVSYSAYAGGCPDIWVINKTDYENKLSTDLKSGGTISYCFNKGKKEPVNRVTKWWKYGKNECETGRVIYHKYSDVSADTFKKYAGEGDSSLDAETLRKHIISIGLIGYPMDSLGLKNQYNLSDDAFQALTQYAVWKYTDGYNIYDQENTMPNETEQKVYNTLINTILPDSVINSSTVTSSIDLYLWNGKKAFTNASVWDGFKYVTTDDLVLEEYDGYQNLLAVNMSKQAEIATLVEESLVTSLKVTKVVDVGQTGKDITNETFTFTIKVTDSAGTAIDLTATQAGTDTNLYPITTAGTYEINKDTAGTNVITATLGNNQSIEIEGLPDGYKYEVEETGNNLSNYTTSVNNNGTTVTTSRKVTGSGAAKTTANVTYTNTVIPSRTLTLKKVTAYAKDADQTFTFTVTLKDKDRNSAIANYSVVDTSDNSTLTTADANGEATVTLKNGQTAAISGLPSEGYSYTISETKVADFSTSVTANNAAVTPSTDDNKITVTGTETANTTLPIVFTNTQDTGKLTVSKTVSFSKDDEKNVPQTLITDAKTTKEYTFTVALKNGDNAYTTADTVYLVGSDGALTSQTISDEGKVTVVLKGESSCTLQIPAGLTYTVTEAAVDNFITTSTGATGTITKDNPSTAAFTNTFSNKKNVVVTKTWVHGNNLRTPLDLVIDLIQKVTSTVPPEAEGGQSTTTVTETTISGENITHTVDTDGNWIYTFADMVLYANGYEVTYTASEPNVPEGYTASVDTSSNVITNTFNENNLTTLKITKAFDGSTVPDREFTFTISLSDKTYNGTLTITRNDDKDYSDTVTMTGGTATVKLKVGDTVTIPQVYSNTTYTVKEQSLYGYRVKKVERTVTAKAADAQKEPETDTKTYTSTYTGTTTATPSMVHLTFTNEVYYPASAVSSSEASEDESSSEPEDDTSSEPEDDTSSQPEESSKPTDSSSKPTSSKPTSSKPSAPNKGTTSSNDAEEGDSDGSNKHGNNNAEKGNSSSKTDGTSTGSTGGTAASGTSQNKGTTAAQGGADSNTTTGQGGTAADQNNPSTGDTSYVMFWTIGAIGSVIAAGMVGIILVAMKRRK